ncbi:pyrroline-5-carboxylate reductase [Alkaliphilus peptidifermentans]|uniref:Pyrroline-5-carboxylate reductase n=1 Tax=Alkaliphilus peptidifermentans DSM 18978 TaxID=1120976 RepID=A0A1G5KL75_9FIRM|nr:pyrroline-5-carboxylate reductase [Alkaliphilus peptidifermentans]SCZ00709.1 pyrroline-5-carboxylate reductase [Alkaliphilus peptidifermentans DSM 18978]
MNRKIGFIGAGNVATTIIEGLIDTYPQACNNVYISNRNKNKGRSLQKKLNINFCENNVDVIKACEVFFICVKPDNYLEVLKEIKSFISKDSLIISIAAGISIDYIQGILGTSFKIVRAMPNIAVSVRTGMTTISANNNVTEKELNLVMDIFNSIGLADVIDEDLIDVATIISSCSPAFVAMFIEALADGGVLQGMSRDKAYKYVAQSMMGTAKMIVDLEKHPGELKDLVSSPAGITIEGVYNLEKNGFRSIIMEAIEACNLKIKSLTDRKK